VDLTEDWYQGRISDQEVRLAHAGRSGDGKVLLVQQARRLGNKQGKEKIILLEFKRTNDLRESYFQDMWTVAEK
jgi:hypothetical protein